MPLFAGRRPGPQPLPPGVGPIPNLRLEPAMKRLLTFILLLAVLFVGVGFYQGWFSMSARAGEISFSYTFIDVFHCSNLSCNDVAICF